MKTYLYILILMAIAYTVDGQEWPHAYRYVSGDSPTSEYVLKNYDLAGHSEIESFRNLTSVEVHRMGGRTLSIFTSSIGTKRNAYLVHVQDFKNGRELFNRAYQLKYNFLMTGSEVVGDTLIMTGTQDKNLQILQQFNYMKVKIDLRTGEELSVSDPVQTGLNTHGFVYYDLPMGEKLLNPRSRPYTIHALEEPTSSTELDFGDRAYDDVRRPLKKEDGSGYRAYVHSTDRFPGREYVDSLHNDGQFIMIDYDLNLVEASRVTIEGELPYIWDIRVIDEREGSFLVECMDSTGIAGVRPRVAYVLFDKDGSKLDEVQIDRSMYRSSTACIDENGGIAFMVLSGENNYKYWQKLMRKGREDDTPQTILENHIYDARTIKLVRMDAYDGKWIVLSNAKSLDDMTIYSVY